MPLPLLWVSLAFMAGIAIASVVEQHVLLWLLGGVFITAVVLVAVRRLPGSLQMRFRGRHLTVVRRTAVLCLAALAAALFGAARYQLSNPPRSETHVAWYNDANHEVLISGVLDEPPDVRDTYINLRLQTDSLDAGSGPIAVEGLVLARVRPNQEFHYGERLRLRGELLTPPANEEFSYRDYLAHHGIHSYMSSAEVTILPGRGGSLFLGGVYGLKGLALRNVYRLFLDPEASLLAGILLGVDAGIPADIEKAFNDTGTSHIIAISGFNIAVIAGLFAFAFNRLLGSTRGAVATVAGILFYAFFVGADPPVLRAAAMGAVALLAVQVGRRQNAVNTLAFVAAFMALFNPHYLWDVGFQLSVLATLGLIVYGGAFAQLARAFIERNVRSADLQRIVTPLAQFFMLTLAAQLTTLPMTAYHFRQISLVSPIANAVILPVQPAVMVLGGAALGISLLVYPLGQLVAWAAWPLAAYTIRLVELFASMPQGVIYLGSFSLALVALFYVMLLGITLAGDRMKILYDRLRGRFRHFSLVAVAVVLFICSLFTWRLVAAGPDGRLHVTVLDVGSADAVLIETPSGGHVLINGGPSAGEASEALGRRMSPIHHVLEWLVIASTDEAQVAALPRLIQRFPPKNVLWGAPEEASFSSAALMERLVADKLPVERAEAGQSLDLGDGATLKVLDVSTRGSTLLLEWNTFRLLLPVGANLDTLTALENGETVGPVSALLLAQSGYGPLAPPDWLENLHPQLVIISVAPADKDGLPSEETLEVLEDYPVLRTDQNGWIEVITDGAQMWITSEAGQAEAAP